MEDPKLSKPIFRDINADDDDPEITEIESLCLQCRKNGTTKVMLTKIPFYKEVVIMSFHCSHCGWQNNELQLAATIQEQGVRYSLKVKNLHDMTRQVVRTESALILIPEVDFEIPAKTQGAAVTTVEGILQRAIDGLTSKYEDLKLHDAGMAYKILIFLEKLKQLSEVKQPFTFILDDPSGNSFLENICAPMTDPQLQVSHYVRTPEQDAVLGMTPSQVNEQEGTNPNPKDEVLKFATNCPSCNAPCETNMKVTNVPNFKEVVIMATNCDACGHRTNEVKSGSGIEPQGTRICLAITNGRDLHRDLLKSETCNVAIPELELEVGGAALGGRFTTVEGLLTNIRDDLVQENPLLIGDGAREETKSRMAVFLEKLNQVLKGKQKATLVLDDPCGNSYIQNLYLPDCDPFLDTSRYTRTFEQNEELGLNDMRTENYSV